MIISQVKSSQKYVIIINEKCTLKSHQDCNPFGLICPNHQKLHYDDVTISGMASQITSLRIVYSTRSFDIFFDPRLNKRLSKQ